MTDDNDDGFRLSRRKALAGLGTVGAAAGLGGLGTYAQFTDTEQETFTFTAGGIDGMVEAGARYNGTVIHDFDGNSLNPADYDTVGGFDTSGALGLSFDLTDVKPGDHGCFSFRIEVTNNPAWVAACVGIDNNVDGESFEPEVDPDPHVDAADVGASALNVDGEGDLADSILTIPFYKPPDQSPSGVWNPCIFYDEDSESYDPALYDGSGAVGTPTQFWSNSESGLLPHTLADAAQMQMIDTQTWGDDGIGIATYDVDDSIAVDPGCVFLNGAATDDQNQQQAGPLQPGTDLYFGWDWHLPFDVGNIAQGDSLDLQLGFVFGQTRHTESAQLSNVFAPQQNLP